MFGSACIRKSASEKAHTLFVLFLYIDAIDSDYN